MVICVVAVPFTGGTSLALANLALISTDIVISEVDNNINEAWESMTEAERNQHKTGYSAWKTFHSGWNTMNTVVAVGSLATLARSGALALNRYAGLLRVNARFNNFVKSGSSFFAAISKKTFGKSFTAFNQRMGKFVGWGASGAGKGRYPLAFIKNEKGFIDVFGDLIKKEGLTLDDFKYLMQKNTNALLQTEKIKLSNIRNSLKKPDANTLMQKVITDSDIKRFLNGADDVGGFVMIAADAKHLETFEDLYYGLRLDYAKTGFFIEDGSCGVLRFKSPSSIDANIPMGGTFDEMSYPFTSTGFTAGKNGRLGVPEWHFKNRVKLKEGSELWSINNKGEESLIAVFDERLNKFVKIQLE